MLHPDAAREIQKLELIPAVTSKQSLLGFEVTAGMRVCRAYAFEFPSEEEAKALLTPNFPNQEGLYASHTSSIG